MKKILTSITLLFLFIISCKSDDNIEVIRSDQKQITVFTILADQNDTLNENISATLSLSDSNRMIKAIVPNGTDITALEPSIKISKNATISPEGKQDFTNPVVYVVTAEDGSKLTYTVILEITPSNLKQILNFEFKANENNLLKIDIPGVINETEKTITAMVPKGTDISALKPAIELSSGASVDLDGKQNFTNPINYTITAENESKITYKVIVSVASSDTKQIISLVFTAIDNATLAEDLTAIIDENAKTITAIVPFGTDITDLTPIIELSPGASINLNGKQDFTNPVEYIVTAENKSKNTYKVIISVAPSDVKQIISFVFTATDNKTLVEDLTAIIDENAKTITTIVPFGTDITTLKPIIELSQGASINLDGQQNFTNPIEYTVTAENKSKITYKVLVSVAPNDDAKQVISFVFRAADNIALTRDIVGIIDENAKTITASVTFGTDITALKPVFELSTGASLNLDGQQNFTNPLEYTVTAQNNTTASYIVTITIQENNAPQPFSLLNINNNATEVSLKPIFTWEAATDKDGDTVLYDFYFGENSVADQLIASDLSATEFSITNRLDYVKTYTWRVVAKDSNGAITESESRSFETSDFSKTNTFITNLNAGNRPRGRSDHESLIFKDKMWIIGGTSSSIINSDVWSSPDGINWTVENLNAPFGELFQQKAVVFNNKIWVTGTSTVDNANNLWSSEDGRNWTLILNEAQFPGRRDHEFLVFKNRMWIIGGFRGRADGDAGLNDVWSSSDGINWTQNTDAAPFDFRYAHTSLVFDNHMWVIGGQSLGPRFKKDVWYSSDGINWTQATSNLPFTGRSGHTSVVFDNHMWVIGGWRGQPLAHTNEVWYSKNGIDWKLATNKNIYSNFNAASRHTSFVFDNKVWIIGGNNSQQNNEVYTFE